MKVDEPNTPFIRYDPLTDKVTNWQGNSKFNLNRVLYLCVCIVTYTLSFSLSGSTIIDLPESVRKAAQEELEDFSLDDDGEEDTSAVSTTEGGRGKISFGLPSSSTAPQNKSSSGEWDRVDEQEKRDKEEAGKKVINALGSHDA